jgi:hypothetical protein
MCSPAIGAGVIKTHTSWLRVGQRNIVTASVGLDRSECTRTNGKNAIAFIGLWTCAIALSLAAFSSSRSVNAEPPSERCIAVSKEEYVSAERQSLLRTRFTAYARTGSPGWRHYWYCHS